MSSNVSVGATYHTQIKEHESVMRAIETGDPEFIRHVRKQLFAAGAHLSRDGYHTVSESWDHNLVPTEGLNHILDVTFNPSTAKKTTWYVGLFTSNSTPSASWDGDWGAVSGGSAVELTAAQIDGSSTRPAVTFGNTSVDGVLTSSAAASVTLAAGVSGLSIYGVTLNSANTVAYNSGASVLVSAVRFATAKQGLDEGNKIDIDFEITAASS